MDETSYIGYLTGPMGGMWAFGWFVGAAMMWAANLKIVSPYVQRAHAAEMLALVQRIEALEREVARLRSVEEQHNALVAAHAARSLKPPKEDS